MPMDKDGPIDYDDINSVDIVLNPLVQQTTTYKPVVHTEITPRDIAHGGYLMPDGFTIFGPDADDA